MYPPPDEDQTRNTNKGSVGVARSVVQWKGSKGETLGRSVFVLIGSRLVLGHALLSKCVPDAVHLRSGKSVR
jgi:hypothetical protein